MLEQLPGPVACPGGSLGPWVKVGMKSSEGLSVLTAPRLQVGPSQQDQHETWNSF